MSIDRRVSAESRRRRVIYQATREHVAETAAERRAAEKLREARRPAASYGSHVNRRLRGRWFSLVPVRRRALVACSAAIIGSAVWLAIMHWMAVSWAPLAANAELARPFRLDRPDSLGNWARTFFLAGAAGTALLVYQLRRYKVDDYKGHYRLWRPVIVLLAIMSIDSVCDLVPWMGAIIDALLGRRMAFSGADWIRVVMTVGGGALALRMLAEVWRSKLALGMMLAAHVGFAIPMSARWNLLDATTVSGWLSVTSAPLLASAALWVSIGSYLRMLFREVRGLDRVVAEDESLAVDKSIAKKSVRSSDASEEPSGWFTRRAKSQEGQGSKLRGEPNAKSVRSSSQEASESSSKSEDKERTRSRDAGGTATSSEAKQAAPKSESRSRRWALPFLGKRSSEPSTEGAVRDSGKQASKATSDTTPSAAADTKSPSASTSSAKSDQPKRRWLGLRNAAAAEKVEKPEGKPADATKSVSKAEDANADAVTKKKRSWFSWGRSGEKAAQAVSEKTSPASTSTKTNKAAPVAPDTATADAKPERKGLGGWLRRDPAAASNVKPAADKTMAPVKSAPSANTDGDDDGEGDDDSVDWSALNKSERRRMRKEIKRGGRAA